jgi:hypothetical protein
MAPRLWQLAPGKGANLRGSCRQSFAQIWIKRFPCGGHFVGSDANPRHIGEAVESVCLAQQCTIATAADIGHDASDRGQDGVEGRRAAVFEPGENRFCLACAPACCADEFHAFLKSICIP